MSVNKIDVASRTAKVTGYAIRLTTIEVDHLQNKHEPGIELHPFLLNDITHLRLGRYQKSVNVNREARPAWTSMFITNPPISQLAVLFKFANTDVPTEECMVTPHRTDWLLKDAHGVKVGHFVDAAHRSMWWPKMALSSPASCVMLLPSENTEGEGVSGGDGTEDDVLPADAIAPSLPMHI